MSRGRDIEYMNNGGGSKSVVDHVFDKLIHIRLPSIITSPSLINLYDTKTQEMIDFVLKHAQNGYVDYE